MQNLGGYQPPYVQSSFSQSEKLHPHRRRRWPFVVLVIVVITYTALASVWPAPDVSATVSTDTLAAEDVRVSFPSYGASAVGVKGGGVLASSANQKPTPVASTAKMMAALAVIKKKPLIVGQDGPTITIEQADVDYFNKQVYEGGSTVPVTLGQKITQRNALEMLLIPSANNIAYVLARWAFGSTENYTQFANAYAKELGATSSNFTDPSGFEASTVSTPHDLVILGEQLMENQVLSEIVKMKRVDLGNNTSLPSTNSFLTLKNDVIGIKTGHHDQAGGCFVVALEVKTQTGQSITVIGAVANAPNLLQAMNDSYELARITSEQIAERTVIKKGEVVGTYNAPWGASATVLTKSDLIVTGWKGAEVVPRSSLIVLKPAPARTATGTIVAGNVDGQKVSVDTQLNEELTPPSLEWRLTHPMQLFFN